MGTGMPHRALTRARLFAILYTSGAAIPSAIKHAVHTVGKHVLRGQFLNVSRCHADGRPL